MYCNVIKDRGRGTVHGFIGAGPGSDVYLFELEPIGDPEAGTFWAYKGKLGHETFIPVDTQGYEHVSQEFYAALDKAYDDPHGHAEFPDPFLDDLAVAGT